MNIINARSLSVSIQHLRRAGGTRRTWKPYYNNRTGYMRNFERNRTYYDKETDRHRQGAQLYTIGLDRDYRIRNSLYQAPNKWETFAEQKERLINQPELHPALDFRTADYSFGNEAAQPSREQLVENARNQAMVRQIVAMYEVLELQKKKIDETIEKPEELSVKNNEAPF